MAGRQFTTATHSGTRGLEGSSDSVLWLLHPARPDGGRHPSKSFPNSPSRNPNTAPSGGKLLFFNVAWGAMSSKTK